MIVIQTVRFFFGFPLVVLGSVLNEIARALITAGAYVWGVEAVDE